MATRILFFGALKDAAGGERLADLPAHVRDISSLIGWLAGDDDGLRAALSAPSVRIAVDRRIVARTEPIARAEEIAFMPPFSGG